MKADGSLKNNKIARHRSNKVALFGSRNGCSFENDTKATFLYMNANKKEFGLSNVYFATKDRFLYEQLNREGYDSVFIGSKESRKAHLKAGYIFCDTLVGDVQAELTEGSEKIFFDVKEALKTENGYVAPYSEGNKKCLFNKYSLEDERISTFSSKRLLYIEGKTDLFFTDEERVLINHINEIKSRGVKLVGYFPCLSHETKIISENARNAFKIAACIKNNDAILITKQYLLAAGDSYDKECSNIINLPPKSDTMNFLSRIDFMITDRISVIADCSVLNKPVVCFAKDPAMMNEEFKSSDNNDIEIFIDISSLCKHLYETL